MAKLRTRTTTITLLAAVAWLGGASPVWAETAYRYWSFWTVNEGTWGYANVGPASVEVHDGDAFGWRFGISTEQGSPEAAPRTDPGELFALACAGSSTGDNQVRVAFLIDAGDSDSAPDGQVAPAPRMACAVVQQGSTSAMALSAIAELRVEAGFVCGVDGYPQGECAPAIELPDSSRPSGANGALPTADTESDPEETDSPAATITVVLIGAITAIIVLLVIRRRSR